MSLLLTDHAVIQRDVPLPLAGDGARGGAVTVTFLGDTWTTVADEHGAWRIEIGPLAASGPGALTIETDQGRTQYQDVMAGDIWVCSGQSNMAMALGGAEHGKRDAAAADDPGIRLMTIRPRVSLSAEREVAETAWCVCGAETAIEFSALGYYTARALRRELDVPIGLIGAAIGNTPGEAWVPMDVLESDDQFAAILERWRQSLRDFPDADGDYAKAFSRWDHEADGAERAGRPIPGAHPKLVGPDSPWTPAGLFNGMIAPLIATPVKGILWYQGAAAPERAYQYRALFGRLIRSWRAAWALGDLPFIYGQEANFGPRRDEPAEHSWAELREAQDMGLAEPNTAMAVAIDLGEEKNIHPIRKAALGERLALAVRHTAYGHDVPYCGPRFRSMRVAGDTARIQFDHTHDGLKTDDGRPPIGFAVSAGCDDSTEGNRGFVWADARIDGHDVLVRSDLVQEPVAVRYAWAQNPDCNLINSAGLWAAPFRTDDWPGVTVDCR